MCHGKYAFLRRTYENEVFWFPSVLFARAQPIFNVFDQLQFAYFKQKSNTHPVDDNNNKRCNYKRFAPIYLNSIAAHVLEGVRQTTAKWVFLKQTNGSRNTSTRAYVDDTDSIILSSAAPSHSVVVANELIICPVRLCTPLLYNNRECMTVLIFWPL